MSEDLRRLVRALSAACARDGNVLKDGALVDALEEQARRVQEARRSRRRAGAGAAGAEPGKTAKKLKEMVRAGESKAAEGVAKRRKLSADGKAPIRCRSPFLFPSTERKQKLLDDFQLDAQVVVRPVAVRAVPLENQGKSPRVSPKELRSASPATIDMPFKSLAAHEPVDLSASMTSTLASYYDEMGDDYGRRYSQSPAMDSRGWSPTSDSIDWTPSDDELDRESVFTPIPMSLPTELPISVKVSPDSSLEMSAEEEDYFSASEDAAPTDGSLAKNPTEVVMEVLYNIMKDNINYKWLMQPNEQARIAKIVEYKIQEKGMHNSDEHSEFIAELRAQIDLLARENTKIQSENAALLESCHKASVEAKQHGSQNEQSFSDLVEHHNQSLSAVTRRLEQVESRLQYQEDLRREAEAAYHAELDARMEDISALKLTIADKEREVSELLGCARSTTDRYLASARGRASLDTAGPSAATVIKDLGLNLNLREAEVSALTTQLAEKDRQICSLHMQLSIKKKLVEEFSAKYAQHMAESDGLSLDFDAFLFQSAVSKQQRVDELAAALGLVERENSDLESRLGAKEREVVQLKSKKVTLSSNLKSARRDANQARAENERLLAALNEQTKRVRALMNTIDDKQQQIELLNEQVDVRQEQLNHLLETFGGESGLMAPPASITDAIDAFASAVESDGVAFGADEEASNVSSASFDLLAV